MNNSTVKLIRKDRNAEPHTILVTKEGVYERDADTKQVKIVTKYVARVEGTNCLPGKGETSDQAADTAIHNYNWLVLY